MTIEKIENHVEQAIDRLPEQYKGTITVEGIVAAFSGQYQDLEETFFDLLEQRNVYEAVGAQLDKIGLTVDARRGGLNDTQYRFKILAKIAQNVSDGSPEDLIQVSKLLTQAVLIQFVDVFPAAFNIVAAGTDLIGTVDDLKEAIRAAKPGGVRFEVLMLSEDFPPFGFFGDDTAGGFGDVNNPSVGGTFVGIV